MIQEVKTYNIRVMFPPGATTTAARLGMTGMVKRSQELVTKGLELHMEYCNYQVSLKN